MKAHLKKRVESLQALMRENGLDAIIFADRENLIYYTGALEIECMAAVIPASGDPALCVLWLDAPYVAECSGAQKILPYPFPASNIGKTIVQAMRELGLERPVVGFHKYFVEFSVFDELRKAFPSMEWRAAMDLTYKVRSVKSAEELELMHAACGFLEAGMAAAVDCVKPGVKEVEVLAEADYAMRKAGSEGPSFRMQVLSWPKQLLAHPFAGDTVIENNQPVVIHLGATCRGYAAKMCRTVYLGDIPEETLGIHATLLAALHEGARALKPGASAGEVYSRIFSVVEKAGYGKAFLDVAGYGVGIRQSEFYPVIGKDLPHVLQKDMVVDLLLPTIYKPRAGGPRITDMLHIDEDGGEFMTSFSREVIRK